MTHAENGGGVEHLGHERGHAASKVVAGPDPGQDGVPDRDDGLVARHEAAQLRHEDGARDGADVGALAAHVRPGDDPEPLLV